MFRSLVLRVWNKGDPHWSMCGIPETFYSDHGSDFTSKHLEQVAADSEFDARLRTHFVERYHREPHSETGVPPQLRGEGMASCRACPSRPSSSICCY